MSVLGILLAVGLASPLAAAPTPDREVEARREQVFEDSSLQTELPGWDELGGKGVSRTRRSRPRREWRVPDPPAPLAFASVGVLLQWVLLALGAVALAMVLVWLTRELFRSRRRATPREVTAANDPSEPDEAAREPAAEGDLEALVRRGEYGAAIHLLLLETLDRLSGRGRRIPAGRTSREVLSASADLAPPAHGALGELVAAVERYLFGGREPAREDFERCRRAFGVVERALTDAVADPATEEAA